MKLFLFLILSVGAVSLLEEGFVLYQSCALVSFETCLTIDHERATNCFMEEIPLPDRERVFPIIELYRQCLERFRPEELWKGQASFEACRWRL